MPAALAIRAHLTTTAVPPRPAAPQRADPRKDPRFQRVVAKLDDASKKLKKHPTAASKANEPAKAAKPPSNEKAAGARAKQVDKLDAAETPKPQPKGFLETLKAEIEKAMPKTLGDTEKFMKGGSSEQMKGSLKGNVAEQKESSTGDMKKTSQAQPSESGVPTKPVTPIAPEPAPPAPQVNGAEAMPAPKSDADVSLQDSKTDVQGQLDKEKLSDARLKKANDPRFSGVVASKEAVGKQADAGPGKYRAKEGGVLGQAAAKALDVAQKGAAVLLGAKGGNKARVLSRQEQQKAKEEVELKTFSDFVVETFAKAKAAVDKRLELLDAKVNEMFDKGIEKALAEMKTYVEDKLLWFKLQRYLGTPWGAALWIKDQILDLPSEVNKFYEDGRKKFTTTMNALAVDVANLVEGQLAAAKKDVKDAQSLIASRSEKLSPGVKARGAKLQAEFSDKFAELESSIEDKKQQLAEGLAQKYKEAFDKADESLKSIKDENKGLVAQAKDKIGEVLKAIEEFKTRLLGVLKKGANAIQIILDDPVQFLKYLLAAIKLGFNQFVDNIWTHLKAGFIGWLFGSLSKMGIDLPTDLNLWSILKLVLGVLGITYAKMRAKAVKILGPTAVTIIEKVGEYIYALITGGPQALWDKVKEDLSNLKEMVIDAIQDWLITTLIKKAVAKIVTLFNPAGAIIQAILLIVDVVKFVVEKAVQILDFVEAVVNSLYDIATGSIGTAANWIEKALGKMIPLLIGFLADLLGLGGLTEKIKEFIKKVQEKVDKAIDKAIAKVIEVVKKIIGSVKAGAKALVQWWKKKVPFSGDGEPHALLFVGEGKNAHLMVNPKEPKVEVTEFVTAFFQKGSETEQAEAKVLDKKITATQVKLKAAEVAKDDAAMEKHSEELDKHLSALSKVLESLLKKGAGLGDKDKPLLIDYPKRRASAYPIMYAGPRVGEGIRIQQDWLKPLVGKSNAVAKADLLSKFSSKTAKKKLEKNKGFDEWTGQVQAYSPIAQTTLGGKKFGLAAQFAALGPGMVLNYSEKAGTGGGGKVNDILRPYGFVPSSKGGEGLDGDHVLERQLGGPDDPDNLWPLGKSENRSSGSTIKSMEVKVNAEVMNVHAAKKKLKKKDSLYLLIRSTKG